MDFLLFDSFSDFNYNNKDKKYVKNAINQNTKKYLNLTKPFCQSGFF